MREYFRGWVFRAITRHEMPSTQAINSVLEEALGGGATASLRADNQGKTMGGAMLRLPVNLPELRPVVPRSGSELPA